MSKFDKIVVIGAGVMGQGISSHIANSNRKVVLLDLKGKDNPNEISERAIDLIKKSDPPWLVEKSRIEKIQAGNLEDNFDECNLIANQLGRGILKGDVILLGSMFPPHPVNMSDFEVSMNGSKISLRFVP